MDSAQLINRLKTLDTSLEGFKAGEYPAKQVGDMFNALLAQAKEALPDDPIVAVINPVEPAAMSGSTSVDSGSIRASIGQVLDALESN